MLSSSSRKIIFAFPPSPPWNSSSINVEATLPLHTSALIPSRCANPCQVVALAHLDSFPSHDAVICTNGSVPSSFGNSGSNVLANCSLCGAETTLTFLAVAACSSFFAQVYVIMQALHWYRQPQQVFHFSSPLRLSDSRSVLDTLTDILRLSFSFLLTSNSLTYLAETAFFSPSILSGYNESPDTHFETLIERRALDSRKCTIWHSISNE